MAYTPSPELRECCIAARGGDPDAALRILRLYGYPQIAREIKKEKPFSNRVRRAVNCITAGCGSETWEVKGDDGSIENLLMMPPPAPGRPPLNARHRFDD
jgi:hypothetical protein